MRLFWSRSRRIALLTFRRAQSWGKEIGERNSQGMRDELNLVVAYAAPSGFEHRKGDPGETQPRDLAARSDLILGKICPLPECPNLGTADVERA